MTTDILILWAVCLPCLAVIVYIRDRVPKRIHESNIELWNELGCPRGIIWRPKKRIEYKTTHRKLFRGVIFRNPKWCKEVNLRGLLSIYRLATLGYTITVLAVAYYNYQKFN